MRHINGYWVDWYNNKWSDDFSDERSVVSFSKTLNDCHNCCDCRDCEDCSECKNSYNSMNCVNCYYCNDCYDCIDCNTCYHCTGCDNCQGCYDCYNCCDYIQQPQTYTTRIIDDRVGFVRFYYGKTSDGKMSLQISWDEFCYNLESFRITILKRYSDNEKYRSQFLKEIDKVKVLFELH